MKVTDNQTEKLNQIIPKNLGFIVDTYFRKSRAALADATNCSRVSITQYLSGVSIPTSINLEKFVKNGLSADFILTGVGNGLLHNIDTLNKAKALSCGNSIQLKVSDDRMAPTLTFGDMATLLQTDFNELEIGGIYAFEKSNGKTVVARLVGTEELFFDNTKYKSTAFEKDQYKKVYKLLQLTRTNFPSI